MRILICCLALAACSQPAPRVETEACVGEARERVVAQLYFGRNIGDEFGVDDEEWAAFVAAEVTPRFPSGFTVADAQGQWRDSDTQVIGREPSKLLIVALADEAGGRLALEEITEAYKRQFQQQGVLMVLERSCVSYE